MRRAARSCFRLPSGRGPAATEADLTPERFDIVVIGSGFGSLFFLKKMVEKRPGAKIAVIERGARRDHEWQLAHGRNGDIAPGAAHLQDPRQKPWNYTIGLGGGTNCWFGQAVRFIPADFEMKTRHGVLEDWPVTYDEIEPYYMEAERIMAVSGDEAIGRVSPRSGPFPLPPHRVSAVDEIMLAARPDRHFPVTTARAPVALESRGRCCASARCHLCPANAKFTAFNGMADILDHPDIRYFLNAEAREILTRGDVATGVAFTQQGPDGRMKTRRVYGDMVVLGANGIHSPAILLRSGIDHPLTGAGLCEQYGHEFEVLLDGVDNFGGGTITTGLNYSLYDTDRAQAAAALLFFENRIRHGLRKEYGRWRQTLPLLAAIEDVPLAANRVVLGPDGQARVIHAERSEYARAGLARLRDSLPRILAPLPVEDIIPRGERPTESHMQCTLRMGRDPQRAVVDRDLIHHRIRNLVVVGSAVFATCPPANPSLTVAALSLRAAERLAT